MAGWRRFFAVESLGGLLLALAALAALVISNSAGRVAYEAFWALTGEVRIGGDGGMALSKPLKVWVNDLGMAVFFFTVGLEIKRELLAGQLASFHQALLPLGAALGGMAVPALMYAAINHGDAVALRGWAIPSATDIAFALGVMALLGSRAPRSLKVFLTAVAIIDDLGAIVIVALFYTADLSLPLLGAAAIGCCVLALLNRSGVTAMGPYVAVGAVVWLLVLKSGVHATLAGVATALAVPMARPGGGSPVLEAEHALQPWIAFLILPVFAFANAGVSFAGVTLGTLTQSIAMGIVAGLVVGRSVGIYAAAWLLVRLAGATFPAGANRGQFFGMCLLCGIGFTMSLFIGGLAFDGRGAAYETELKLGVFGGSLLSAVLGTAVLWRTERRSARRRAD